MESCTLSEEMSVIPFDSVHSQLKQLSWMRHVQEVVLSPKIYTSGARDLYNVSESTQRQSPLIRTNSSLEGALKNIYLLPQRLGQNLQVSGEGQFMKTGGLIRSQSCPVETWHNFAQKCARKVDQSTGIKTKAQPNTLQKAINKATHDNFRHASSPRVAADLPQHPKVEALATTDLFQLTGVERVGDLSVPVDRRIDTSSCSASISQNVFATPSDITTGKVPEKQHQHSEVSDKERPASSVLEDLCLCSAARDCPPSCKVLERGRRKEMEDTATIVPSFVTIPCGVMGMCSCDNDSGSNTGSDLHFFGIYDGHGGSQASLYCMERLHVLVAEEIKSTALMDHQSNDGWTSEWEKIMVDCFSKVDQEVGGVCPNGICSDDDVITQCPACEEAIAPENVGTTAVVAVVGSSQIVVANCGDSRAVLSRGGKAVPLTNDHKPEREDESVRIEAAGGKVICWDGYRVGGFLALSRAIGDRYLKRYVISEPEVICVQREEEDDCLILGSDGLWDVISNDYACQIARKGLLAARRKRENKSFGPGEDPASLVVAAFLVKLAYSRGSKDNISVVVIDLKS